MSRHKKTVNTAGEVQEYTSTRTPFTIRAKKTHYMKWGRIIPFTWVTIERPEVIYNKPLNELYNDIEADENIEVK